MKVKAALAVGDNGWFVVGYHDSLERPYDTLKWAELMDSFEQLEGERRYWIEFELPDSTIEKLDGDILPLINSPDEEVGQE